MLVPGYIFAVLISFTYLVKIKLTILKGELPEEEELGS
jgi:hypothetical protein